MTTHLRKICALALVALLATACGGGTDTSDTSDSSAEAPAGGSTSEVSTATDTSPSEDAPVADATTAEDATAEVEQADITIGYLPVVDFVPIAVAQEQGYFAAEGLTVTLEPVAGGAAAIPSLLSGEIDVSIVNWVSFFYAIQEGLPITAVAEAGRASPGNIGVYVTEDSPIREPADLAGATISTNQLNNVISMTTSVVADSLGVDSSTFNFLEMPLPNFIPSMMDGTVDAAWLVEPLVSDAKSQGARLVMEIDQGPTEGVPIAGYAVTNDFAAQNPGTVAAFARAMARAAERPEADLRAAIPAFAELPPELASAVALPEFVSGIDPAALQLVADLMSDLDYLDGPIVAADHITLP